MFYLLYTALLTLTTSFVVSTPLPFNRLGHGSGKIKKRLSISE